MTPFDSSTLDEFQFTMPDKGLDPPAKPHAWDPWWAHPEVTRRAGVTLGDDGANEWVAVSRSVELQRVAAFVNPDGKCHHPAQVPPEQRETTQKELRSLIVKLYTVGFGGMKSLVKKNVNHWEFRDGFKWDVTQALLRAGGSVELPIYKRVLVHLFDCEDRYQASMPLVESMGTTGRYEYLPREQSKGYIRVVDPYWANLASAMPDPSRDPRLDNDSVLDVQSYLQEGGANYYPTAFTDSATIGRKTDFAHQLIGKLAGLGLMWTTEQANRAVGDERDVASWNCMQHNLCSNGGVVTLGALKVTIEQLRLKHQEWLKWLNLVGDPDYLTPPTGATLPSWVTDRAV